MTLPGGRDAPYLRHGMSIQEMALLLPQHGDDAALLYMLGVVSGEQAMQAFLLCEKQYPDSVPVRTLRAEMLASQGRYDEAVAAYRLLADLPHPPPGIHHDLAMLYRKTGEWDEALREFQQQQRAQPDDERSGKFQLCRGATRGRPSAVTVDIVAPVIPARAPTGGAPTESRSELGLGGRSRFY